MYAVVEHIRERMSARVADGDPGETALDRVLGLLNMLRNDDVHARAMFVILIESVTGTPGLRPAVVETNTIVREAISRMITEAADSSAAAQSIDVSSLAVLIEAILRGVAMQWIADPEHVDLDSITTTAQQMVRSVLGQPHSTPGLTNSR